jgi:hypothetical protein
VQLGRGWTGHSTSPELHGGVTTVLARRSGSKVLRGDEVSDSRANVPAGSAVLEGAGAAS